MQREALIEQAAQLIEQADGLVFAAGAGMGVDSGLPDFRGKDGFWQAYPALAQAKIDFHEIASPQSFEISPLLAWGFYGHRLKLYRDTQPHAGFALLKRWGESAAMGYSVFTSNVDSQFQKAGFDAAAIHECHGSLHHLQCMDCAAASGGIWPADAFEPEVDEVNCLLINEPPRCPACGGLARPNVLMFNDWGWLEQRAAKQQAQQNAWLARVSRPVVIELGAGTAIPSVRHFSQRVVHQHGGRLVRINLREAAVPSGLDVGLPMGALAGLQAIAKMLQAE